MPAAALHSLDWPLLVEFRNNEYEIIKVMLAKPVSRHQGAMMNAGTAHHDRGYFPLIEMSRYRRSIDRRRVVAAARQDSARRLSLILAVVSLMPSRRCEAADQHQATGHGMRRCAASTPSRHSVLRGFGQVANVITHRAASRRGARPGVSHLTFSTRQESSRNF